MLGAHGALPHAPFRFTIPYRDSDLSNRGRYAVRATVRQGERLLFTTDTITSVLQGAPQPPVSLQLVQVDLAADGTFQLHQSSLPGSQPAAGRNQDDIGRWRLEPGSQRLVLQGGREAPVMLQPLDQGAALRKLGLDGRRLPAGGNDRLQRLPAPQPIDLRLHLIGQFRYMAARPAAAPGKPMLVNLEGLITSRAAAPCCCFSRRRRPPPHR